jgi:hypothetical protein
MRSMLLICLMTLVGGCESYSPKLEYLAVEFINESSYKNWVPPEDLSTPIFLNQGEGLLRVEFAADSELVRRAVEDGTSLWNRTFFCDSPDTTVKLSSPDIYMDGLNVSVGSGRQSIGDDAEEEYYFWVRTHWVENWKIPEAIGRGSDQESYAKYDLRKDPEDICFQVFGGNMVSSFESKAVRIDSADIAHALTQSR